MEEVNREVREFGVAVPGGVEHVRARKLHTTSNWLAISDCPNAFNAVKRTAVLVEVANYVPALTPFVARCHGTRPADVFFRMNSRETRTIPRSSGVQQGDPMEPAMFFLPCDQDYGVSGRNSREKEWKPSFTWTMSLLALCESRPTRLMPLPSSDDSSRTSTSWSTPPRPWLYHQKATPRRRRIFRSSKASMSALPAKEG